VCPSSRTYDAYTFLFATNTRNDTELDGGNRRPITRGYEKYRRVKKSRQHGGSVSARWRFKNPLSGTKKVRRRVQSSLCVTNTNYSLVFLFASTTKPVYGRHGERTRKSRSDWMFFHVCAFSTRRDSSWLFTRRARVRKTARRGFQ